MIDIDDAHYRRGLGTARMSAGGAEDSLLGMSEAVRHGLGVGLLLCLLGDQEPNLVRLAAPNGELNTQVWILTHPDLRNVARIKAITEHLYAELSRSEFIVQSTPLDRGPSQRPKRASST